MKKILSSIIVILIFCIGLISIGHAQQSQTYNNLTLLTLTPGGCVQAGPTKKLVTPNGNPCVPTGRALGFDFFGVPTANLAQVFVCPQTLNFPANFFNPSSFGSCGAVVSPDTYSVKSNGVLVGQIAFANPALNVFSTPGTGTATLVLTAPPGLKTGQDMIAIVQSGHQFALTGTPPGWSLLILDTSSTNVYIYAYYHQATSSDIAGTTTYTWTWGGTSFASGGIIAPVNTAGVDVIASVGSATNVTTAPLPSVTTTATGDLLISAVINSGTSITNPGDETSRWNYPFNSGINYSIFAGTKIIAAAGPTGVENITIASGQFGGITLAMKMSTQGTFTTTGGLTQNCTAGQRLEIDAPASPTASNCAMSLVYQ